MKKRVSSKPLWWIIILAAIGFITSFYLTWEHIVASSSGSICDISAKISCSLVNSSIYSELLSVPVAVFGALWFVILSLVAWRSMKNNDRKNKTSKHMYYVCWFTRGCPPIWLCK